LSHAGISITNLKLSGFFILGLWEKPACWLATRLMPSLGSIFPPCKSTICWNFGSLWIQFILGCIEFFKIQIPQV
jgi:hypothetical protein